VCLPSNERRFAIGRDTGVSGVRPCSEVCVRCRCWTEWTENQIRASSGNGCKCLIQESYAARPRGLEFPTFWLPHQTVPVKFTLIKSFRFKEWCAQGDDCGVEMWRGGLGLAYLLPALSAAGASLARPHSVSTSRSSLEDDFRTWTLPITASFLHYDLTWTIRLRKTSSRGHAHRETMGRTKISLSCA